MKCKICGVRRARRFCPGVNGDICSICCGTERENTVHCPFSCVYLQEARLHERPAAVDAAGLPNKDIVVREHFLEQHAEEVNAIADILARSAFSEPGTTDNDVRETLEGLIRTYRTLQTGLYYDTRPENAIAARVFARFQEGATEYRKQLQSNGLSYPSDAEVLTILVFLQRLEFDRNNGRRLGRAFLELLQRILKDTEKAQQQHASPLIHTV